MLPALLSHEKMEKMRVTRLNDKRKNGKSKNFARIFFKECNSA